MPKSSVIISYIPALHKGYINFFDDYPDAKIYVLSEEYVKEMPRMDRDIRALPASVIQEMLQAVRNQEVKILTADDLKKLSADKNLEFILPDEELNRSFTKSHLSDIKNIKFVSTFLRWDRQISTAELEVSPDRVISEKERDQEIMGQAFEEAKKSPDWWRQIGAVITRQNEVLFIGHNRPFPSEDYSLNVFGDPRSNFDAGEYIELSKFIHGEANLIAQAAKKGIKLEGASIYVTTFPCPVCAKLIATAGFKRVYYSKGYSLLDAEDVFRSQNIEIILVKT